MMLFSITTPAATLTRTVCPKELRFLQLNAARSASVNDEILFAVQSHGADIICVKEPFNRRGILAGSNHTLIG